MFAKVLLDRGVWCVSLRAWTHGTNAPGDDVTMWRYGVDVVPNLPKCPVPDRCCTELTEVFDTGIDVVPIQVPVLMSYRTYRVGYRD